MIPRYSIRICRFNRQARRKLFIAAVKREPYIVAHAHYLILQEFICRPSNSLYMWAFVEVCYDFANRVIVCCFKLAVE